ncbi:alpha/beta hydrolase [Amycolatopsis arida]|uniref:alpha/beta hydrolase n=1 Tax=Amycolatopsis arida TaxID=587909 RepID=UPI001FBA3378|nr:alpha/beta hydrolase [Amycolatopsis arida]
MTGLVGGGQAAAVEALDTNGAPVPELNWAPCPDDVAPEGYECATAEVPLSYRNPHGQSITLAVGRLPATDQANKLGTIFYNPGGPGGPGRIAPPLTPELHERFDIVGFDPRGIGASTPLSCFPNPEDARKLGGPFPITPAQERERVREVTEATEICGRNAGPLIDHMSTANVARDMDLLRQAVGEDMTSYYGISYGSHVGSVYANLFPERVGAVVIDAVLDPVEWTTGYRPEEWFHPFSYRLGSHLGAQRSLESFLDACSADERCAFREPGVDLLAKYNAILDRLLEGPLTITLPEGQPQEITYQLAVQSTLGALYSAAASPVLAEFLQALHDAARPDTWLSGPPVAALPPVPSTPYAPLRLGPEQGVAVMCADSSNPGNPYQWGRFARKADEDARGFGSQWTWLSVPCATWPGADKDRYTGPWNRDTANPVLVIGNGKGDPATPYEDARKTADMLGDARLLTLDTFGHGALGESACVDAAVSAYFADGTLPAEGTVCQPDRGPFDEPVMPEPARS